MSANPALQRMSRAQRAAQVHALHDLHGLNGLQIAKQLGISRSYAYELLEDPLGGAVSKRKARYFGVCELCGGPTSGTSGGKDYEPSICGTCNHAPYWTRGRIIEAIQLWADDHGGVPPKSLDWGNAGGYHPDYRNGEQPSHFTVARMFGSFNNGLEAAGFEPHMRRDAHRYTPEFLDEIVARIRSGESSAAISLELGLSDHAVGVALRSRGLSVRELRKAA